MSSSQPEQRNPPKERPARTLSREEEAAAALPHTTISRNTAVVAILFFATVILGVPITQFFMESRNGRSTIAEIVALAPSSEKWRQLSHVHNPRSLVQSGKELLPDREQVRTIKENIEKKSPVTTLLLPPMQYAKTAFLREGNSKVRLGQSDWLFDQDHISQLIDREGMDTGDKIAARLIDFKKQFAQKDIEFVVLLVPAKPDIYPEKLSSRLTADQIPLKNLSYDRCLQTLRANHVPFVDGVSLAAELRKRSSEDIFMHLDTHCFPILLETMAQALSRVVQETGRLTPRQPILYKTEPVETVNAGDLVNILRLPPGQKLYHGDKVRGNAVRQPNGAPWASDPNADVLLLGDSFTEIFSPLQAGLGEHLSLNLRRPVDRVYKHEVGTQAFKDKLQSEMLSVPGRFTHKRVVVWEFVVGNFYQVDWSPVDLELDRLSTPSPAPSPH